MSNFWFIVAVVFIILWLTKKGNDPKKNNIDRTSLNYRQGYWEGYVYYINNPPDARAAEQAAEARRLYQYQTDAISNVITSATPTLSAAEIQEKKSLRHINLALYMASFLIVAAAAIFIGTALPSAVRFVGVLIVMAGFYVGGLYVYRRYDKLKPAAIAFVGTGLAILPFVGVSMYNLILPDASLCWLITSIIGVAAFVYAANYLNSQIVAYFSIAFMISLATSSVSTLGVGLIWYFVVVILFSALIMVFAKFMPNWVSKCFVDPIYRSSLAIVPLTLVASLFSIGALTLTDYWVISLTAAVYYAVSAMISIGQSQKIYILSARVIVSFGLILLSYDLFKSLSIVALTMCLVGIGQVFASLLCMKERESGDVNNESSLWFGFAMQILSLMFVLDNDSWASLMAILLSATLMVSLVSAWHLKRAKILSFAIFSAALLPFILGYHVITPAVDSSVIASIFVLMSAAMLMTRSMVDSVVRHKDFFVITMVGFGLFLLEAVLLSFVVGGAWPAVIWLTAAILVYALTYIQRLPWISIIANVALAISVLSKLIWLEISGQQILSLTACFLFILFYGAYWLLKVKNRYAYTKYFWWSAIISTLTFGLMSLVGSDENSVTIAGLAILVAAAILARKGAADKNMAYYDISAIIGTIGLQSMANVANPDLNILVYSHWWAMVFAILGQIRLSEGQRLKAKTRVIIGLSILSLFSGVMALSNPVDEVIYRTIFFIEHIMLFIAGLVMSRKLIIYWGMIGSVLAIAWLLSGSQYSFMLPVLFAIILIAFAVRALIKQSANK